MKKTLNIGILGFGAMGKTHAYAVQNIKYFYREPDFEASVFGVCTTDFSRTEKICCDHGIPFAAKNEDELIFHPQIDIISICTPNVRHYETIKKAISATKHVYCEKPLCVTFGQAREVSLLAAKSGVRAGVVFNNRHLSAVIRAKELIDRAKSGVCCPFRRNIFTTAAQTPKNLLDGSKTGISAAAECFLTSAPTALT